MVAGIRVGLVAVALVGTVLAACDEEEAPPEAGAEPVPVADEDLGELAPDPVGPGTEGPEEEDEAREPLYAMMGDQQLPVRTVLLEKGEAEGRLVFFQEEVTCEAIPDEGQTSGTVISVVGVEPENPEWVGALRTRNWWYMQEPEPIGEGEEWTLELSGVSDEGAEGTVRVVRSGPDRMFRMEGDFEAVVCSPTTPE